MEDEYERTVLEVFPHYHYPGDGSGDLFQGYSFFGRTAGGSDHLYPASQSDALSDRKETYEKKPDGYPHVNRDYSDFSDSDISGRLAFNQ